MKRSLKTHSASLKSSESCTLLFFYGHPSSKPLSVGPSADFYSCLDFCWAVLWLVDAVLCKISAFAAALESKWSKTPQIPSPWSIAAFSLLWSPQVRGLMSNILILGGWEWTWGVLLQSLLGRDTQHTPLCFMVSTSGGFLSLLQVNHVFNAIGNF